MSRRTYGVWLTALVLLGLAFRLAILASPLGELDGDEAVVGLMARHIAYSGERPAFYYGQPYLGSLEAFSAAPLFAVTSSSTQLLKLVPTLYSLGFLVLTTMLARRLFGHGPALITAAYLALPPAMWAVWSTKARGGYAELLFLGAALLLITVHFADVRQRRVALLWGLVAGLACWTHLLAVVYVLPAVVYLGLRRRGRWSAPELGLVILGSTLGLLPLLLHNAATGFPTLKALLQPPDLPLDPAAQFFRFFRVGVPVLAGLAQPTTSEVLFDQDWLTRPAGQAWIAVGLVLTLVAALAVHLPSLRALVRSGADRCATEPALLLFLAMAIQPVIAVSRFGFFVSEPRYALPLYSTVPLLAVALRRFVPVRWLRMLVVVAVLGGNILSLMS